MDDDAKELAKAGMAVVLAPFIKPLDNLIGLAGGDYLEFVREQRKARRKQSQAKVLEGATALLMDRKVQPDPEASLSAVEEILDAAQDAESDEIMNIWKRLLAAAVDPARRRHYRREYVDLLKKFEPLDAAVFLEFENANTGSDDAGATLSQKMARGIDEIVVSLANLSDLGLTRAMSFQPTPAQKYMRQGLVLTAHGAELKKLLND